NCRASCRRSGDAWFQSVRRAPPTNTNSINEPLYQAGEETHTSGGQDVGKARERLAVERETPVRVPHDHSNVLEDEGLRGLAGAPPQLSDLIADLVGPRHVVVPDGP